MIVMSWTAAIAVTRRAADTVCIDLLACMASFIGMNVQAFNTI